MTYRISLENAQEMFPDYIFIKALTPSVQKAAFHVQDSQGNNLCLKIIAPDFGVDRIEREIIILQSIIHPNVARLVEYTFSTRGGSQKHFILEEFIAGRDLEQLFTTGETWAIEVVCDFFIQLSEGLVALERENIVHRDLKPENIRVRQDGSPVIIDFGLARHLNLPDLTTTDQGAALGTPMYFAPEQFIGTKRDIDPRTDLFALGILLYQALFGRHPFYRQGMTYDNLREVICNTDLDLSSTQFHGLQPAFRLLLSKLLEKQRVRRPAKAAHVGTLLRNIRSSL